MTRCIYHEADLDGVMSAAIVKKYFKGDIDLLLHLFHALPELIFHILPFYLS